MRVWVTTERRNDGTSETEETQTAADTSGTAAETSEKPELPATGETFILLWKRAARDTAKGVSSGGYFRMSSLSNVVSALVASPPQGVLKIELVFCSLRGRPGSVRGRLRFFSSWC